MEILQQPNGIYTIVDKPQPEVNLNLTAAVIEAVHNGRGAGRKNPSIEFKAPVPARLDGDAHARIDAAVAKRERKAAKLRGTK
ncbi:hypothetical protein QYH69_34075 [Paraburkholderia sp. SARCC-3016]|nr:hypothetical protein [Paraburkholderia sp. SARCC-3016]